MRKLFIASLALIPIFFSCEKSSKLTVAPEEIILYSEGSTKITTNASSPTFTVADDFYASVEADGTVKAKKVGETTIRVSGNGETTSVPVTIMSMYSLYPDLDKIVGKNKSAVSSLLGSGYTTGTDSWVYKNYNSYTDGIVVTFENERVSSVGAIVSTSYTSMMSKYLLERYSLVGMQNDMYFFLNHDKNASVVFSVYNVSYLMAVYVPYTDSKAGGEFSIPTEVSEALNELGISQE